MTERAASRGIVAGLAALAAPLIAAADPAPAVQAYGFTPSSRVTYTTAHRMGKVASRSNRILGTITVAGTEIGTPFTLRVPIASFRGVPTRDVKALQALGGARHPEAVLVVERLDLVRKAFVPGAAGGRLDFKGQARGKLTLRGVTRPVEIDASGWAAPRDASVNARFAVSLAAFGIKAPRWLMSPVADRVEVQVEGIASRLAR